MPRRHKNVRQRNLPRAAQRTARTQPKVRPDKDSSRLPRDLGELEAEYERYAQFPAQAEPSPDVICNEEDYRSNR